MSVASMRVVRSRGQLRHVLRSAAAGRVGLVPTMGALHAGHRALVERCAASCDTTVVSIFVNPLQFGAGEDLERYPRSLDADLALCAEAGASLVFAPAVDQIYPAGPTPEVSVNPGELGSQLEGEIRPDHFRGVLTVVAKLLHLAAADVAFFGEKDYQQLVLIRRMVADLDFGAEIVACPTVREADGLALSSRNRYLSVEQRATAAALPAALRAGADAGGGGATAVLAAARAVLAGAAPAGLAVDYLELRSPELAPPPVSGSARLLAAVRLGTTRLIDNVAVPLGEL